MIAKETQILVVDDSSEDVALTLHALKKNPLIRQVHVVHDGEEALNFLFCREPFTGREAQPLPDLILLDLKLPRVDGLSVLRALKRDPRTRGIPVIALTSSREDQDLAASYDLGVNSYIQKPLDFDTFREVVAGLARYWLLLNQPPPRHDLSHRAETPR